MEDREFLELGRDMLAALRDTCMSSQETMSMRSGLVDAEAAQSAAQMIDSIHAEFQETGSGAAVVSRLKTAYRSASAIVEINYWTVGAIENVDERLEVFHELDTAAVALVEAARMAALQIEYLAAKFGASDWEGPVAAVAAAVELSEDVEAYFGSEALRKKFDEWRVASAEALAVNLAKFSR